MNSNRPMQARTRITLVTSAVVVATAATTVTTVVLAMGLIPRYQFTVATATTIHQSSITSAPPIHVDTPQVINLPVITDPSELVRTLLLFGIVSLCVCGAAGVWGSWFVAGRALAPVMVLNTAVQRAAGGSFDHRVGLSHAAREFQELGDAFDKMLDQLEQSFGANERFAANASHELRTPLATTKLLLEMAATRAQTETNYVLLNRLAAMNDRASKIVSALLSLNDVSTRPLETTPQNLRPLIDLAVQELSLLAAERRVTVTAYVGDVTVPADAVLLERAIVNIVRNAVQHNRPGGHVFIHTSDWSAESAATLTITNSGKVLDTETLARITEPFYRPQGRHGGDDDSHGLGLPLAARILDAHHGTLHIIGRPAGGLTVTMSFAR